ncbi:hypothetical protein D3C87_1232650 [compost metagenome]
MASQQAIPDAVVRLAPGPRAGDPIAAARPGRFPGTGPRSVGASRSPFRIQLPQLVGEESHRPLAHVAVVLQRRPRTQDPRVPPGRRPLPATDLRLHRRGAGRQGARRQRHPGQSRQRARPAAARTAKEGAPRSRAPTDAAPAFPAAQAQALPADVALVGGAVSGRRPFAV